MKSYEELLEKALNDGSDIVAPVAKALGLKRKEAADKIGDMSIDDTLELVDAVDRNDDGYIMMTVDNAGDDKDEDVETLSEAPVAPVAPGTQFRPQPQTGGRYPSLKSQMQPAPGQTVFNQGQPAPGQVMPTQGQPMQGRPMQGQPLPNQQFAGQGQPLPQGQAALPKAGQPVLTPSQPGPAQQQQAEPEVAPGTVKRPQGTSGSIGENFSIGDEVLAAGKKAVVKVPSAGGNGDLVGVLKDGNLTMVKGKKVKHDMSKKIDEHVLGMTAMPNLQRMTELAGISPEKKNPEEEQVQKKPWEKDTEAEQPDAAAKQPEQAQPQAQPQPQAQAAPTSGIQVHDIQTGQTQTVAAVAPSSTPAEPVQAPVAQQPEQTDPRVEIMAALDSIERVMPELRVGDFKDIRARLEKISNMVFESQMNRRRKL